MKEQRPRGETHLVRVASGKGRPPCELRFLMWNQAVVPASLGAGEDSVRGCRWVPITQERAQCPACSVLRSLAWHSTCSPALPPRPSRAPLPLPLCNLCTRRPGESPAKKLPQQGGGGPARFLFA